jgi:hypothetical protein
MVAAVAVTLLSCTPVQPTRAAAVPTAVMRPSRLTAEQLAAWFHARSPGGYRATVPVEALTLHFLDEGAAQGVSADVAFAQSVLETGYFRFPDAGQVRPEYNNFAGLGAEDNGGGPGPARFATAQLGVRAQIQHLWAYADPAARADRTARPLIDPRFALVQPKGKAPTWDEFGGGNWATDLQYGAKILTIYTDMLDFARERTRRFVSALYRDLVGRTPDEASLDFWTAQVGLIGRGGVALHLAREPDSLRRVVTALYDQALGRSPDIPGREYWVAQVQAGVPVTQLAVLLFGSPEFYEAGGGTNAGYVTRLYRRALFRDPDSGGAAYWTDRIDRGLSSTGDLAWLLYQSAESRGYRVTGLYQDLLGRQPDGGGLAYWTEQLAGREDVALAAALCASDEYFDRAQA